MKINLEGHQQMSGLFGKKKGISKGKDHISEMFERMVQKLEFQDEKKPKEIRADIKMDVQMKWIENRDKKGGVNSELLTEYKGLIHRLKTKEISAEEFNKKSEELFSKDKVKTPPFLITLPVEPKAEKAEIKETLKKEETVKMEKIEGFEAEKQPETKEVAKEEHPKEINVHIEKKTSVDLAKEFTIIFESKEKNHPIIIIREVVAEKIELLKNRKENSKENTAEKIKDERTIQDLRTVIKAVKNEAEHKEVFDQEMKNYKVQSKEKSDVENIQSAGGSILRNSVQQEKMISIQELKTELPKEIKNLAEFQVITPKKISVLLDQKIGGAEIRLEKVDGSIMIEVRVDDFKAREQIETVLRDIKDDMGSRGIELKYEMKEEERKQEKRKEEGFLEEKRQNREQQKQEGQKDGNKRS